MRVACESSSLQARRVLRGFLQAFGITALAAYCAWWGYWLGQGMLPTAPLRAIAGLPAPTTGCTRSIQSVLAGDWAMSLRWNLFAIPLAVLFAMSVALLAWQVIRGRKLMLPGYFLHLWLGLLLAAWVAKFVSGPAYW